MKLETSIDYKRFYEKRRRHHSRYKKYVSIHGLPCQDCGGRGGEIVPVLDYGVGPFEECGFCEGTGLMTRWMRGLWLYWKRQEKKDKKEIYGNH